MSNNKQSMKLYTEEQVREAYLEGWNDGKHDNVGYIDRVLHSLIPIELPSDEEIKKLQEDNDNYDDYDFYDTGFKQGVKWMKEQILNQNK